MVKQDHGTQVGQRVRLKIDGQDKLYNFACAGSQGWVRKHDHDSLGYPKAFIEWDKDHWTYNGEPDGWALDAHFEPVEGDVAVSEKPSKEDLAKMFAEFVSEHYGGVDEEHEAPDQNVNEEYVLALQKATEMASQCDSFMMIGISHAGEANGYPAFTPYVLNYYKDAESGLILEAHVAKVAFMAHQQTSLEVVKDMADKRSER